MKTPTTDQITTAYLSNLAAVAAIVAESLERLALRAADGDFTSAEAVAILAENLRTLETAAEFVAVEPEQPVTAREACANLSDHDYNATYYLRGDIGAEYAHAPDAPLAGELLARYRAAMNSVDSEQPITARDARNNLNDCPGTYNLRFEIGAEYAHAPDAPLTGNLLARYRAAMTPVKGSAAPTLPRECDGKGTRTGAAGITRAHRSLMRNASEGGLPQ
jgi:hypothetical protein